MPLKETRALSLHRLPSHDRQGATKLVLRGPIAPYPLATSFLEVSEAKRLRALEDKNAKLKRMPADAMLDNVALKDLLGKKW